MKSSFFVCLVVATLFLASAARAHVVVEPRESAAGEVVIYNVRVPSHLEATTIALDLEIPKGIEIVSIAATDGGHEVRKASEGTTIVHWTTKIPADERASLTFVARNPAVPTQLAWKAHQVYDNGVTVDWIEPKGGKEPASITMVISSASQGENK